MKFKNPHIPPTVNLYVDAKHSYGQGILRGILRYANLRRRWKIQIDWVGLFKPRAIYPDCDGSIVAGIPPQDCRGIQKSARHVVNCSTSEATADFPTVHADNILAGELAATHLHGCNLKHFAFYPAPETGYTNYRDIRFKGFVNAVEQLGFPCAIAPTQWPQGDTWLLQHHHPVVAAWIASLPKPVGIMAADDLVAYDLAHCCQNMGVSVPDQVAIIGVNNDDLMCEGSWPPLSSVHVDYSRVGFRAAQLLDRLLQGERLTEEERVVKLPPLGVVQRASTSALAVSDPLLAEAIRYMRDHACDPCNVQDVLRNVPIARRRLERLMFAELGRTPHQEILRTRIETAVRLLIETDFPVIQVAHQSGFSAIQNFNKAFRTQIGETPAAYRRASRPGGHT